MRTTIEINDKLMADVLRITGVKTKREAVERGLLALVRLGRQLEIRQYRGKLHWEGNLEKMRRDR